SIASSLLIGSRLGRLSSRSQINLTVPTERVASMISVLGNASATGPQCRRASNPGSIPPIRVDVRPERNERQTNGGRIHVLQGLRQGHSERDIADRDP